MYYEVYIDVIFFLNLLMDFILLSSVKFFFDKKTTIPRIFLGSIVGAFLYCLVTVCPISVIWIKQIIMLIGINIVMLYVTFRIKSIKQLGEALCLVAIITFMLGGILQWVYTNLLRKKYFLVALVLSVSIMILEKFLYTYYKRKWEKICQVTLVLGEEVCKTEALIDTGNGLYDPYTKKPVSIIEYQFMKSYIEKNEKKIRYIPYHSVGKKNGLLPAITLSKLVVNQKNQEKQMENVVVAMVRGSLSSKNNYHMILHPDLLEK